MSGGDKEDARWNWKKAGHRFFYLPDDIILEILSRLDTKVLPRLRCVCKLWNSWIPTRRLLFCCSIPEEPSDGCRFSSVDMNGKVVGKSFNHKAIRNPFPWSIRCYSNDLPLVLVATSQKDLYLCYPSKGELVRLPEQLPRRTPGCRPYPELVAAGLGYVSTTNKFKVVRILDRTCQVLTIGGTNRWRKVPDVPYPVEHSESVFLGGVIYFAPANQYPTENVWSGFHTTTDKCILAFDLEREDWRELPLPVPPTKHYQYSLTVLRGLLCLVEFYTLISPRRPTKLWTLIDRENIKWSCDNTIENFGYAVPLQIEEDGGVLMHSYYQLRHYDPKEKSTQAFGDVKYITAASFYLEIYLAARKITK